VLGLRIQCFEVQVVGATAVTNVVVLVEAEGVIIALVVAYDV
jgi:hypothetical protein